MQYVPQNNDNVGSGSYTGTYFSPQQHPPAGSVPSAQPHISHGYGAPQPVTSPQANFPSQSPVAVSPDLHKKVPDRKSVASKLIELTYLILIILESLLALRFIFKLLGANPENPFIQFLYEATLIFTYPFSSIFSTPIQNTISVSSYDLEFTTLVAMGVYALIAYIVVRIIDIFR